MGQILLKESTIARFHSRSIANTKKRMELIHVMEKLSGDTRKKLEHWNSLSHLIDGEIEERFRNRNNPVSPLADLASVGEKY